MKFTQLSSILRKAGFSLMETGEWSTKSGKTRIRIHPERDLAAVFRDVPGHPPDLTGKVVTFGQAADVARGKVD